MQDQYSSANSGGDSDQTHILNGSNSWSQTVDGGTADRLYVYNPQEFRSPITTLRFGLSWKSFESLEGTSLSTLTVA